MNEYIYDPPPAYPPVSSQAQHSSGVLDGDPEIGKKRPGDASENVKRVKLDPEIKDDSKNLEFSEKSGQKVPTSAGMPGKPDGSLEKISPLLLTAAQDIEKWVAERRKKWPSRERVAQKTREAPEQRDNADSEAFVPQVQPAAGKGRKLPFCRYFAKGSCRSGESCRFSHGPREGARIREKTSQVYPRFEAPVKSSLFVKFMQSDHDAEDLKVLKVIDRLYKSGQLDPAEKPDLVEEPESESKAETA